MPKARRAATHAPRHNPLHRACVQVQGVAQEEVVPVLAKLPDSAQGAAASPGETVWALASVSNLLADDTDGKHTRLLLSKNIIGRVLYALDTCTDLEVRREASGVLRNICLDGHAEMLGEVANKGGLDIALRCLRWAALGLQSHERSVERARAPQQEERARLLTKPVEEMNRKERRHAAKLRAGVVLDTDVASAAFALDTSDVLDLQGWGADAAASLRAMAPDAALSLVEMCASLVTLVGCAAEASEKLTTKLAQFDWQRDAMDETASVERSAYAGEGLCTWLCQALWLGMEGASTLQAPLCDAVLALVTASANTLCALTEEDACVLACALAGLPTQLPSAKRKKRDRQAKPVALPTPAAQRAAMARGSARLAILARAVDFVQENAAPAMAVFGTMAAGVLCNVHCAMYTPMAQEALEAVETRVTVAHRGPLDAFVVHTVLAKLVHLLATSDVHHTDALHTAELALEILAEMMSSLAKGAEEAPFIAAPSMEQDDCAMPCDEALGECDAPFNELGHAVFAHVLQTPLLDVLAKYAAPSAAAEQVSEHGAALRALAQRALAVLNNFLLRLALFAPPPPSQWPAEKHALARISMWRAWVSTRFLDQAAGHSGAGDASPVLGTAGEELRCAWRHCFAIAAHWAAVPSVAEADTSVEHPAPSIAHDGLAMFDTCLGCMWSIARLLEGQLDIDDGGAPTAPVQALIASYHATQLASVRVKSMGTLALLARSQVYLATSATVPPSTMRAYAILGEFFIHAVQNVPNPQHSTAAETLVAALNAVIDTYANELAPWDVVYREQGMQEKLVAALPTMVSIAKHVDRRANPSLYGAVSESVDNLRGFLEYRASL
ncbi:hypothetical protein MVES_002921 [Malassezia vespertilionis]|uniref:SYO1-like TPR repeats domain-containing protein n=1 Tax=Malassezia vespertilionis TaxID=2020962 RepID=A0A2N1J9J3_9BASI|nr:hypothetical protein MVES_002921 [Malassezia vespertilionis]